MFATSTDSQKNWPYAGCEPEEIAKTLTNYFGPLTNGDKLTVDQIFELARDFVGSVTYDGRKLCVERLNRNPVNHARFWRCVMERAGQSDQVDQLWQHYTQAME